ncbi:uncharacterized protein K441DRAFT_664448 [Cenococcum geophilum 1.58]|uniref:uncharacterized protein n=1 Tax=Cenococcum geophilum 1.58 TaxID=794803 RepID=UPI00358F79FA|nr:hypothetical protein K441DRAFT_664448 [Cenococcum geophilum 1.58]
MANLLSGISYDGDQPVRSEISEQQLLAERCFLSLATTYFGSQRRQSSITRKGLQLYGLALKDLNKALNNSSQHRSLDLNSVVTMASFEVGVH